MFVKHPIAKPCMYLDRINFVSIAQKIMARHTIIECEYIATYLGLLDDKDVYNHKDFHVMLNHLHIIMEDPIHSPWHVIHAWSQKVVEKIEKKKRRSSHGIMSRACTMNNQGSVSLVHITHT